MGFDRPDMQFATKSESALSAEIASLYDPNLFTRTAQNNYKFLPEATWVNGSGEETYLSFGNSKSFDDHSTGEPEAAKRARLLEQHPELQPNIMVADRARDIMMDLLGIERKKSELEKIASFLSDADQTVGMEEKAVSDAWQAMPERDRRIIESELRESSRNPDLATPLFNRFVNQEWSGALYAPALNRRALYLHAWTAENK